MKLWRRTGRLALLVLAVITGALIAIGLFGRPVYHIGALRVRLSVAPAVAGETRVSIPPLGEISARTHAAPIALQASVEEASVEDLRAILIRRPNGEALIEHLKRDTRQAILGFAARLVVLALVGGAAAAYLVGAGRRAWLAAAGGVSSAAIVLGVGALTCLTYDIGAFKEPRLTNALQATPWILRLVKEGIVNVGEVDAQVRAAAANIYRLENTVSSMVSGGEPAEQIRILAISDLHNNTVAMQFARDIARLFDVQFILNAGDLTDFGTGFESELAEQVKRFDRPHVFVAGNHDSVETVSALARLDNTHIPDEQVVRVDGLRILGQHDPASRLSGVRPLLPTSKQLSSAGRTLEAAFRRMKDPPDILLVHEPAIAKRFLGRVPIVVSGHDHTLAADLVNGSAWIRPGSTGASGVRYFTGSGGQPVTAAVIYVTPPPEVKAVGVDLISISSPTGEFTITRKKFSAGQ